MLRSHDAENMSTGKILAYSDDAGGGVIQDSSGRAHYFSKAEWKSPETKPEAGMSVIFSVAKKHACDVHLIQPPALENNL